MTRVKKQFKRIVAAVMATVITMVAASALLGCSLLDFLFGDYIEFTRSSITMRVGETFDISTIIESETDEYELISSDSSIVSVDGHILTAIDLGAAYITAETGIYSDRIRVNVSDAEHDGLSVSYGGELVQTMGNTSAVIFVPTATGSVMNGDIVWSVNGEEQEKLAANKSFSFMPCAAGVYEITATAGAFTATNIVRCYYEIEASVTASGELTQNSAPYSAVDFTVVAERNENNPDDYIQWFEDDKLLYAGTDKSYKYMPTPGRHTLRAFVNGKPIYTTDSYFRGSVVPNKPELIFDNMYPHIYITHETVGKAQFEITSGVTGEKTVCASDDPKYAARFTENGFDAAGIITLCTTGNTRKNYTVRVKSLGDGDVLTESEYSESLVFTQLPSNAKRYVETLCLDNDLYITSEREYVAVAEYYINYRKKTVSESKVAFDCYIAYNMLGTAQELWEDAFPIAATSGEYRGIRVNMTGNVLSTSFTVSTVNTPVRQAPASLSGGYSKQLHAVLPHINFDEQKYRPDDYVFSIDKAERTQAVTYTDELYLAVQRGVKPVCAVGSPAETVYAMARDVLKKICTDDMTDVEKAHAVYDWIMWHVTYDTPASYATSGGEMYSAYYLEGVFADGVAPIGGVVYKPYAVCDGISKAYSLLCNMEGIPCVRVSGSAGDSLRDAGGHAWNKVFVSGAWYGVDCTWGDATTNLALELRQETYELGLHDCLFLTETEISEQHYEPYDEGTSSIKYAPVASENKMNVYKSITLNGTPIDCYVSSNENKTERTREIADKLASAYRKTNKIAVPGERGESDIDWQAMEIYYEDGAPIGTAISTLIANAFRSKHRNAEVRTFTYGNILLIMVR